MKIRQYFDVIVVSCTSLSIRIQIKIKELFSDTIFQVSENAVLFMAYGCCQKVMLQFSHHHDVKDLSLLQNATAGGLAAFWSSLVLCPTELIKCRLQVGIDINTVW